MIAAIGGPPTSRLRLAVIGLAAGTLSGLFGVGGGALIVPLLILWLGYGAREATGTSLAAIVLTATVAALVHSGYGNLHAQDALLIGLPAVGGVVAGTALQQRVPERAVALFFAALLVVSAGKLIAG